MTLPSSPPLPSQDPPSSPPLLPTLSDIAFSGNAGRKRLHSDYGSLSSDPLFSEDVSELDFQDESEQPKRKRLVKGPWWDVARKPPRQSLRKNMMKKEGFRNVDSGVWMGSDGSDDSLPAEKPRMKLTFRDDSSIPHRRVAEWDGNLEDYAAMVVQDCSENGKETVDLSGIGLNTISDATLRPLHQMIKHIHDDLTEPPSEDLFGSFTPCIQLFLYGNLLTSLPPELFRLENITVLSLRNNRLQEFPSCITRLHKLAELNIAGNQLTYLPWELLGMLRSADDACKVSIRPNPFKVPRLAIETDLPGQRDPNSTQGEHDDSVPTLLRQLEMRFIRGRQALNGGDVDTTPKKKSNSREQLIFLAPSRILYKDSDGSVVRSATAIGVDGEITWEAPVFEPQSPPTSDASTTAPSLFELALRSAQRSYDLRNVSKTFPVDTPPTVARGLEAAATGVDYGNERCTSCSNTFVIPRAVWLEYWFRGHEYFDLREDKILPFKRKACSWACAQVTTVGTAFA